MPDSGSTTSINPMSGRVRSRRSSRTIATTSCLVASTLNGRSYPRSRKSESRKITLRRWRTRIKNSIAAARSVPRAGGSNASTSRTSLSTWVFPFRGGMYRSTPSANRSAPARSLLRLAASPRTAAISAARSRLSCPWVPKRVEALPSTARITVSSRSSTKRLTNGVPRRAVTFQSIVRTSSPGWYSRTSLNSTPRPLKTLEYSPEKTSLTRWRVWISRSLTFCASSAMFMEGTSGDVELLEDPADQIVGVDGLGFRLVRQDQPVTQHVVRHRLDVVGHDVRATAQKGVRLRGSRQEDPRARRCTVRDERLEIVEARLVRIPRRLDDVEDVLDDAIVDIEPGHHLARMHDRRRPHDPAHSRNPDPRHASDDLPFFPPIGVRDV